MLDVIDLDFDYLEKPLLKNVNFQVLAGDLLHLRGANGVGKTTLLKLLTGVRHPLSGYIQYNGSPISQNMSEYQSQLCFVGHRAGINPNLTVRENCLFDLHYQQQNIETLAAVFKLTAYLDRPCGVLSAGQCRQVGLLRLWMSKAPLWVLDEPLVALDEASLGVLMQHIAMHRAKGGMVILSSHQMLPLHTTDYQEYLLV